MTDREIVIALAEKVMGWSVGPACRERLGIYPRLDFYMDDPLLLHRSASNAVRWNPLESISDAWMIVTKLQEMDKYVRVEIRPTGKHTVDIWRFGKVITERGEDIPRLICEAALKAVAMPAPKAQEGR